MSEFIRPTVSVEEISDNLARVSAEPLERGYGDTLGNSLRRVLLSSLEGAAVEAIQIDGVQHEFTTVPGVYEDVTDIVLNVKGLVFRSMGTGDEAASAAEDQFIPFVENAEGAYEYTVPAQALDEETDCAAWSIRKESWYDRTLVFESADLPSSAYKA